VICKIVDKWDKPTCQSRDLIVTHQNQLWSVETTVLKSVIIRGQNPKHLCSHTSSVLLSMTWEFNICSDVVDWVSSYDCITTSRTSEKSSFMASLCVCINLPIPNLASILWCKIPYFVRFTDKQIGVLCQHSETIFKTKSPNSNPVRVFIFSCYKVVTKCW
jgi:hypothetical protein